MRRADRLFQIVQRLRRRGVTTAQMLAEALEVSERTIYRDIQDLMQSGVPIQGEAGVGYALPRGFDLPPLMFTEEEIEALVLGARIVQSRADPALARAADSVLAKVENVLPDRLRERLARAHLFAPKFHLKGPATPHLGLLREAVRGQRKLAFAYMDRTQVPSRRAVWPLGLFFWGETWSLAAWCELRQDFRSFRVDRIIDVEALAESYPPQEGRRLDDFFKLYNEETGAAKREARRREGAR